MYFHRPHGLLYLVILVFISFTVNFMLVDKPLCLMATYPPRLRIDNSGWGVNSSALFDVAGLGWCQRKYHVLYTITQPIINSIY